MGKQFHQLALGENTFQVEIPLEYISIDKKEIAFALGYTNGMLPEHFDEMIDGVMSRTPELCKVQTGFRLLNIDTTVGRKANIRVGEIDFHTQQIVALQLRHADQIVFFLCSIGSGMEQWSKQCAREGDQTMSYFVDTVASFAVETAVDVLHDHLTQYLKTQGLNVTNRYSPGYCDWSVEEQHKLFSFFPKGFCGVSLTDSALMIPIKSISGIIGVGKNAEYTPYFCDACGRKDCTYKAFREKRSKTYIKGNEL
ncbi:MAG: vitamin B12 dependent-methionine synthase activation domain-containing protein [Bacteroidota bacterium]